MDASLNIVSRLLEKGHHLDDLKALLSPFRERGFDDFAEQMAIMLSKVSALLEISNELSETLSLDTLLGRIIEIATQALDADRGTLFLHDAQHKELFSRILQGDSVQEIRFPCHLGIAGAVFTSGEPIVIHDAYSDPRFNKEIDRKTGYHTRNILCAPIKTRHGEAVGVIQLLNKAEARGPFNQDDLVLLRSITSQASAALQNAQLFEQVQKARAEQERLLELSTAISSELQLSSLLAKIMETTTIILNAERSTLFLHDHRTNELWAPVAQGMEGSREIRFPSHLGIAGSVFTSGNTINIPDAYADPRFNKDFDRKTGFVTRNILCMPVINKSGKVIGVTQVLNKRGGPFTRYDEQKLAAFSAQASIAIENARLFEDVMNMKNYNESILQSMSNALMTLDGNDHIVTANAAAGRMLHCEAQSLMSQTPAHVFGSNNDWLLKLIAGVNQSKKPASALDSEIVLPDNKHVSVNASAVPLISITQEPLGTMLVFDDISGEKRLRGTLARYMTKEVADRLVEEGGDTALGGNLQRASVLFSDIRSFTTISERIGAAETVALLNEYFTAMVDIVFNCGGILDKYIGDAIMAVFGVPFMSGQDADNSVRAGVDMLRALKDFNRRQVEKGREAIDIGIGISTDDVLVGNIGSMKRMDYTVIGDGVNLASRLEGANKFYRTHLLLSEYTFREVRAKFHWREIDRIRVKGKTKPVAVFEVLDYHDEVSYPNLAANLDLYHQAIEAYKSCNWEKALRLFERMIQNHAGDGLPHMYSERCRYYQKSPPPSDWDGVYELKDK